MTDQPTPEKIKAFLDDLARISLRHNVVIAFPLCDEYPSIVPIPKDFTSYEATKDGARISQTIEGDEYAYPENWVHSLDLTQLSAHERIEILGNRSPDLGRMLREAFMAGVDVTGQGWNSEHPGDSVSRTEFEGEADEYAAKIMGGLG